MKYRDHAPYHERNLDQQILDTLMRIEELLTPKAPEATQAAPELAKAKRK